MEESNTRVNTSKLKRKKIIIQKGEDVPVVRQKTISPNALEPDIKPFEDPDQSPKRPSEPSPKLKEDKKTIKSEESKRLENSESDKRSSLPRIQEKINEIKRKPKKKRILKRRVDDKIEKNKGKDLAINETPSKLKMSTIENPINTDTSGVDLNLSGLDQQKLKATTKLELGIFDKNKIKPKDSHENESAHKEESAILPIFRSFMNTHIILDLIMTRHPLFTRSMRWTLIFFDIFLNLLQIISILDLSESPVKILSSQSISVYAFSKIWIPMYTSVTTQILVFGAASMLRANEAVIMDRSKVQTDEQFKKQISRAKIKRMLIFLAIFALLLAACYCTCEIECFKSK